MHVTHSPEPFALSELERQRDFALLAPGFARARAAPELGGEGLVQGHHGDTWLLLRGLRPCARAEAGRGSTLLVASFEDDAERAACFVADEAFPVALGFDVAPATVRPLLEPLSATDAALPQAWQPEVPRAYRDAIAQIREAIAAGDVYQVCLTLRAQLGVQTGSALFARMQARGPARFGAWLRLPDGRELVSASPERFFALRGARVHAEPMKGTARADEAEALGGSEKDRRELAMITDLVRNDLYAACLPGSIVVDAPRSLVRLPYALQTVSEVSGKLRPGTDVVDLLRALHPGGSVVGAPKHAALRLLRTLEASPRGLYCGALALWQGDQAEAALLIRSASRPGPDDPWVYGVGGGIVFDSSAEGEWAEIGTKLGVFV